MKREKQGLQDEVQHVLFATHRTRSVTQMSISLFRHAVRSLQMEAWKEGNICFRDTKRWMSDPHLEPHLDQSSLAWCSIQQNQIHTVLALYWLFSCICCQNHGFIYWRERINIPECVEWDILKTKSDTAMLKQCNALTLCPASLQSPGTKLC